MACLSECRRILYERFNEVHVLHARGCPDDDGLKPPCPGCWTIAPERHLWNRELMVLNCRRQGGLLYFFREP